MANELKWILLLHVGATLMMTGIIWIIQVVHYPLFNRVGAPTYIAYQSAHMNLITLVVGPLMLIEAGTGLLLALMQSDGIPPTLTWIGLALIAVVWLITMFVNTPQHVALSGGYDAAIHNALVTSNWIRTLAWSARGVIVLVMVAGVMH